MKEKSTGTQAERLKRAIRHRQEQEKQELRQAIVEAAGTLFLEQGYEHFSLRKVAERIGYSPTTIYLYFRDKEDLLFTVVDEGFTLFDRRLAATGARVEDPWERIIELGRTYIDFGLEHPQYYQLMFMQRPDLLALKRLGESQSRLASFQHLQNAVQQALDAGVLRPGAVQGYTDALWATVHGLVSLAITMPSFTAERLQPAMEATWRIQCEGIRQP